MHNIGIFLVCLSLTACGGSTSSGTIQDACGGATACTIGKSVLIDVTATKQQADIVDTKYGMTPGTYYNAVLQHELCHARTNECPREEERQCVEIMRGALRDYPQLLADTRESWDQHWQSLPCGV
jgi:hypothetical protein